MLQWSPPDIGGSRGLDEMRKEGADFALQWSPPDIGGSSRAAPGVVPVSEHASMESA